MALHWIPPIPGQLKINVHGASYRIPHPHTNDTGMGAVYRDSAGMLRLMTVGTIHELTPLGNQLWAIFIALRRAFKEGFRDVVLETDNLDAFRIIKNFRSGVVPASVLDIASQIDIRINDHRWFCSVAFIFPARNGGSFHC